MENNLILDGEAWRERDHITYTSLLDRYGAADLFSGETMERCRQEKEEENARAQELTEYLFSGQMKEESGEENMAELIFSEELKLTRARDYNRAEEDYSLYFVLAELLSVLAVLCVWMRIRAARKRRREADAVEADMEG